MMEKWNEYILIKKWSWFIPIFTMKQRAMDGYLLQVAVLLTREKKNEIRNKFQKLEIYMENYYANGQYNIMFQCYNFFQLIWLAWFTQQMHSKNFVTDWK